ncbi:hypothetical protein BKA70DRAFT_1567361 [Coprinopsis sp. MPI-PUGE-AT-0042]|nr:hypothetical protein BKA70DRAFT_1567361 [Coprinopsis sp. MPI-PUGE-AT-0042]
MTARTNPHFVQVELLLQAITHLQACTFGFKGNAFIPPPDAPDSEENQTVLIPNWLDVGRLLLGWLATNRREPEDILSIRMEILQEIELFGDFLGSLKSFAWASGLWSSVASNCEFTLGELDAFFVSGSPSLQSLRVEEVIVIAPLGRTLSIPLRFADSLEDIHEFLKLG